jgi:hypothetical protein
MPFIDRAGSETPLVDLDERGTGGYAASASAESRGIIVFLY